MLTILVWLSLKYRIRVAMDLFILSSHLLPAANLILLVFVALLVQAELLLHICLISKLLVTNSERLQIPLVSFALRRQNLVLNYLARKLQVIMWLLSAPRVRSKTII